MPNLELKPDDYRVQTKRGNWLSREDGRLVPIAGISAALIIGFVWWHRSEIALALLFGLSIMMAIGFGMVLGAWLKRFD